MTYKHIYKCYENIVSIHTTQMIPRPQMYDVFLYDSSSSLNCSRYHLERLYYLYSHFFLYPKCLHQRKFAPGDLTFTHWQSQPPTPNNSGTRVRFRGIVDYIPLYELNYDNVSVFIILTGNDPCFNTDGRGQALDIARRIPVQMHACMSVCIRTVARCGHGVDIYAYIRFLVVALWCTRLHARVYVCVCGGGAHTRTYVRTHARIHARTYIRIACTRVDVDVCHLAECICTIF